MALTPEDVVNKQFTTIGVRKKGYDEGEVDQFLNEIEAELRRLHAENNELRSRLTAAQRAQQAAPPQAAPAAPQAAPAPPPPPPVAAPAAPAPVAVPAPANVDSSAGAARMLELAQRTADEH